MKASIFRQHGGPEVLEYTDVPDPTIRANEVLVEVKACALNHLDIFVRKGLPGIEIVRLNQVDIVRHKLVQSIVAAYGNAAANANANANGDRTVPRPVPPPPVLNAGGVPGPQAGAPAGDR